MNLNEKLVCKCFKAINNEPVAETKTFLCPICNAENQIQNISVEALELDSNYKLTLNRFKVEIEKLETILRDPENFIYDEIHELKRQVDLDREILKCQIDELADELIQKLESLEKKFIAEHKDNMDLKHYSELVESSKKKFGEYEEFLRLFSTKKEELDEKCKQNETEINSMKSKLKQLRNKLFSNSLITYKPSDSGIQDLFGKLIVKDGKEFYGTIKKELNLYNYYTIFDSINALAVLPNGDLVIGGSNGTINIWDSNDVKSKNTLTGHYQQIHDIIVIDDNCLIVSDGNSIKIWNINEKTNRTFKKNEKKHFFLNVCVYTILMLKNGDLASGTSDSEIVIWNIKDGKVKKTIKYSGNNNKDIVQVKSLVLLKNGDLASASTLCFKKSDNAIKIWDIESERVKRTLTGHTDSVTVLTVLENGDLVSGSADKTIKIWNVETGNVIKTLTGHINSVSALKVFDNGDLVSGSVDCCMKIWDVDNRTVKKDINVNSKVNALVVLPNGRLVSGSDRSIIIWE